MRNAYILFIVCCLALKGAAAEEAMPITPVHEAITSQHTWLNTSRALTPADLQGRIVLLDFWTFCCINCMHVIPDLKYLEETFGDKLTVIGVHSAKFKNEQDTENIRNAILRYGIEHAVVNDFDFSIWRRFGVRAWPTFALVSPEGRLVEMYSGEGNRKAVEEDVRALLKKYEGKVVTAQLPIALEKHKTPPSLLSFPGKLAVGDNALFVSDSAHHRIVQVSLAGKISTVIGSGKEGFADGSFETAQFRRPQGMVYKDGKLYIADTENHALRMADLKTRQVTTIAGTGKQGFERGAKNAPALKTPLASPWDVAFYPDERHIAIAMAGTHQLWSYDIDKQTVSVLAGNGRESIDDGEYPYNSLSQPSGLSVVDGKLYFVDSETSSLRVFEKGEIHTLIGTGLFDFGYHEGRQGEALMQHPLGVYADASGVYVADSYNHSIRRYDVGTKKLSDFAGNGVRGAEEGALKAARFNEPGDIKRIGDTLYIADTNNNRIRVLDMKTKMVSSFAISEAASTTDYTFSEELPGVEKLPEAKVKAGVPLSVHIALAKGWKINADAPSQLAVFENGKPLAGFDKEAIKGKTLELPALKSGHSYRLQATLFYCEEKEGSQCLLKSVDQMLAAQPEGVTVLDITL